MQGQTNSSIATIAALTSSLFLSLSQVQLKAVVASIGVDSRIWRLSLAIEKGILWQLLIIGACSSIGIGLWIFAIRNTDLTDIYWTTATCYIFVPLLSILVLNETVSTKQAISYLLIAAGIASLR